MNDYVCMVDMPRRHEYVEKTTGAGGKMVVPRDTISGLGWLSWLNDTAGDIFGMMQADTQVASWGNSPLK